MTDTLKTLRLKKGFTQGDLAEKLGVTTPTVSSWERGNSSPYPKYVPMLAKILRTSEDTILLLTNIKKLSKK